MRIIIKTHCHLQTDNLGVYANVMNSVSSECWPLDVVDGLKVGIGVKKKIGLSQLIYFSLKFMTFNEKVCSLINFVIAYLYLVEFFSLVLALNPSVTIEGQTVDSLS